VGVRKIAKIPHTGVSRPAVPLGRGCNGQGAPLFRLPNRSSGRRAKKEVRSGPAPAHVILCRRKVLRAVFKMSRYLSVSIFQSRTRCPSVQHIAHNGKPFGASRRG